MNTLTTPQHCFRQAVLSFWVPSVLLEPRFQRWVSDGGCVVRDGRSRKDGQDLQNLFLLEAGIQEGLQLCGTDVSSLLDELPCEPRKSRVFRGTRQETLPDGPNVFIRYLILERQSAVESDSPGRGIRNSVRKQHDLDFVFSKTAAVDVCKDGSKRLHQDRRVCDRAGNIWDEAEPVLQLLQSGLRCCRG